MDIFQKPKVHTVSEWLEVATKKLEETAKERIGKEIETHYAEAVQAHCQKGLKETDAKATALVELGDARTAGRWFRREHLTERDVQKLKSIEKESRSFALLFLCYFLFLYITVDPPQNGWAWLFWVLEIFVLLVFPTWRFFAIKRNNVRVRMPLLLIQPISGFVQGLCVKLLFDHDSDRWGYLVFGLLILNYFISNLRLWRKIAKVREGWSERPPTTASQV